MISRLQLQKSSSIILGNVRPLYTSHLTVALGGYRMASIKSGSRRRRNSFIETIPTNTESIKSHPIPRHSNATIRQTLRRKIERDKKSEEQLAKILKVPTEAESTPQEIKTVDDLKKMLPGMPPEDRQRVTELIQEYGDKLNDFLSQPLSDELNETPEKFNDNETADSSLEPTEYATAIDILQRMTEEIIEEEQDEHSEVEQSAYNDLWKNVRIFGQMKPDPRVDPPFELLVVLFQLAKNQKDTDIRNRSLKTVGDILYGFKLVRLDPYNEVDYLNALVISRKIPEAIKIWDSRRSKKDVENSIWWLEVGACLYLENHDLASAEKIATELMKNFDYVPPKVSLKFIMEYVRMGKVDDCWRWCRYLIKQTEEAGGPGKPLVISGNLDTEEAAVLFNKKCTPTKDELLRALDFIVSSSNTGYSLQMLKKVQEFGIKIHQNLILNILKTAAKRINLLNNQPTLQLLSEVRRGQEKSRPKSSGGNFYLGDNLWDQIVHRILIENPELQRNRNLYQIWIYGLANMGRINRAYDVLNLMIEKNLQPTTTALHSIIKILLSKKLVTHALTILEKMENPENTELKTKFPSPLSIHYALFIQYGARRSNQSFVDSILERMAKYNVHYDESVLLALFHYYYRSRNFTKFFELLNQYLDIRQFSTEGYIVIWKIIRDYYRTFPVTYSTTNISPVTQENTNLTATDSMVPDLRSLLLKMIHSPEFIPLAKVYEPVVQTFLIVHDHAVVFAVLKFMSEHNNIPLDPSFCFKLTKLAQKMGDILKRNARLRPSSIQNYLLSSSQNQIINTIAAADRIAKNETQPQSINIPLDTLLEALCLNLHCSLSDYKNEIDDQTNQFISLPQ